MPDLHTIPKRKMNRRRDTETWSDGVNDQNTRLEVQPNFKKY